MAWVDDRIWCHPKIAGLSHLAFRIYICSLAYSGGFGLGGVLTKEHQHVIHSTAAARKELVAAGLWEDVGGGAIEIHDWKEHNEKRDARRRADRDRKRTARNRDKGSE